MVSLRGEITDAQHRRYWSVVRAAEINAYATPTHLVSDSRERLWMLELGAELPLPSGVLHAELRGQSDTPNTSGSRRPAVQVEGGYRASF